MYKTSSYQSTTIDTFEILGGHIVGIFYNHIYDKAKELHATGKTPSITESYKVVCRSYLQHFRNDAMFKKTISNINEYFNFHTQVPTLSYSNWVDNVTREFVPKDFWSSMNAQQKDQILANTIESIYQKFSLYMLSSRGLLMVVDNHDEHSNIALLQDRMISIMIEERERIYQKFIQPSEPKENAVANKLRSELVKEVAKNQKLREALVQASAEIKTQQYQIYILEQSKAWLIERARAVKPEVPPPSPQVDWEDEINIEIDALDDVENIEVLEDPEAIKARAKSQRIKLQLQKKNPEKNLAI